MSKQKRNKKGQFIKGVLSWNKGLTKKTDKRIKKAPIRRHIDNLQINELLEKRFNVLRLWGSEINKLTMNNFRNKLRNTQNGKI